MDVDGDGTPKVRLRRVREDDLEVLFAQQHDPEAARRAAFPIRPRAAFLRKFRQELLVDPDVGLRAVLADAELAGYVVSWTRDRRRMIGYWLGREFWGRRVGVRALRLYVEWERVRPLYADPQAGNLASLRLLERCGFRRAGVETHPNLIGPGELEHVLYVLDDRPSTSVRGDRDLGPDSSGGN